MSKNTQTNKKKQKQKKKKKKNPTPHEKKNTKKILGWPPVA